jgi:hypothetical protein
LTALLVDSAHPASDACREAQPLHKLTVGMLYLQVLLLLTMLLVRAAVPGEHRCCNAQVHTLHAPQNKPTFQPSNVAAHVIMHAFKLSAYNGMEYLTVLLLAGSTCSTQHCSTTKLPALPAMHEVHTSLRLHVVHAGVAATVASGAGALPEFPRLPGPGRPRLAFKRPFPELQDIPEDIEMADVSATNTIAGSQPNASPLKPKKKKPKSQAQGSHAFSTGQRPNVSYLAMTGSDLLKQRNYAPMQDTRDSSLTAKHVLDLPFHLRQELMLDRVPQRSDLWLALRGDVTATSVSTVLGFSDKCGIALLGAGRSGCIEDHAKVGHVFMQLKDGIAAPIIPCNHAMDWGTLHEGNCKITAMRALPDMQMREVGVAELQVDALSGDLVQGVDLGALPRFTASPDGLAVLGQESCSILLKGTLCNLAPGTRVLFEAKCRTPFVTDKDPTKLKFLGSQVPPAKKVSPDWYAQVQLGMLAADVGVAVLAVYATGKTMIVCIPRDDIWCNMMLKSVQWFMQTYVKENKLPAAGFCRGMPRCVEFMKRTKDQCAAVVEEVLVVGSVNNTTSELVWLDGAAATLPVSAVNTLHRSGLAWFVPLQHAASENTHSQWMGARSTVLAGSV